MKSGFFGVGVETLLPGTREGGLWIRRFRRFRRLETQKSTCADRHVEVFCTKHISEIRIHKMRFFGGFVVDSFFLDESSHFRRNVVI